MAATHLRLGRELLQGEFVCEIGFQALNGAANAGRHGRSTHRPAVLIANGIKHAHGQRMRQGFEVYPAPRALVFGFFHQEPANSLNPLIHREKMMPTAFRKNLGQTDLFGQSLKKTRGKAKIDDNSVGPFPFPAMRHRGRRHEHVIAADVMMAQAKFRDGHPGVPFFCPGTVPKGIRVSGGCERRGYVGRIVMDSDGEFSKTGPIATVE